MIDYVKEIADIENPDQRRSDYSKPIRIVGTKVVNKLFNHIYDINSFPQAQLVKFRSTKPAKLKKQILAKLVFSP